MKSSTLSIVVRFVWLFAICPPSESAEAPAPIAGLPEHLVIANSSTWVPYSFLDEQGQPSGILVDRWRLFADRNGLTVEFMLVDWEESMRLLHEGAANLHGGLIRSPDRESDLHFFPQELLRIRTLLFINERLEFNDLADFAGTKIGVVAGSYEESFVGEHFPGHELVLYANSEALVQGAIAGEVGAFVSDYPTGYYHLISRKSLDHFRTGPTLFTLPIYAATRPGDRDLLDSIAANIEPVKPEEARELYEAWLIPSEPLPSWIIPAALAAAALGTACLVGLYFLALRRQVREKTEALREAVGRLETANQQLDRLARTDALTGLANRLAFFELAPREIERAKRYERPLSLAILDLDKFKAINDKHGHQVGDNVIRHLAEVILGQLRSSDLLARIGGEEFALLLPETGSRDALKLLERMLDELAARPFRHEGEQIRVSFSAGLIPWQMNATLDDLIAGADKALYRSKSGGRARVTMELSPVQSSVNSSDEAQRLGATPQGR